MTLEEYKEVVALQIQIDNHLLDAASKTRDLIAKDIANETSYFKLQVLMKRYHLQERTIYRAKRELRATSKKLARTSRALARCYHTKSLLHFGHSWNMLYELVSPTHFFLVKKLMEEQELYELQTFALSPLPGSISLLKDKLQEQLEQLAQKDITV